MFSLRLPGKSQQSAGWSALCAYADRLDIARMGTDGERPRVELLESYERGKDEGEALKRLRKKFGLHRARTTTLLSAADYQILQIESPAATDPAERMELVRARVQDMIDTPIAHVTVDAMEIPTQELAPGRPRNAYAVVAGNAAIAPKMRAFHDAGIALKAIDIPEMALRNIATLCEQRNRGLAFLAFGDNDGLLTFTCNGELYMARRIEVGLKQLMTDDLDRRSTLYDRIGLEVQRSLDNFDRQYGFIPLARLLLGPQPEATPLQGFLGEYLSITVDVLDLADVLDLGAIPELRRSDRQAQCLLTLGAALRREDNAS